MLPSTTCINLPNIDTLLVGGVIMKKNTSAAQEKKKKSNNEPRKHTGNPKLDGPDKPST